MARDKAENRNWHSRPIVVAALTSIVAIVAIGAVALALRGEQPDATNEGTPSTITSAPTTSTTADATIPPSTSTTTTSTTAGAIAIREEVMEGPLDARLRFDNYEYELVDIADGVGYAGQMEGAEVVAFSCDSIWIVLGPTDPPGFEDLRALAESIAEERSCTPPLNGPYECLGLPSDPVACTE